jgi:hypothetical protein
MNQYVIDAILIINNFNAPGTPKNELITQIAEFCQVDSSRAQTIYRKANEALKVNNSLKWT